MIERRPVAAPPDPVGMGSPLVCGAVGRFDPDLAGKIASGFDAGLREVHRDRRSALWLDREPVVWHGSQVRGLSWSERLPGATGRERDWRQAASAGGCSLLIDGGRRGVHASSSGIAPLYWLADRDAAYFATAVDPLARAAPRPLSVDWAAWASILTLGYPPDDRTPFLEIKRLDPLATLEAAEGSRPRATAGELAWVEPAADDSDERADGVVAALRSEIAQLDPSLPVHCPLSGGWDSRLLLCLLAERDLELGAWTTSLDLGETADEDLAPRVAASLGIPHRLVTADGCAFPDALVEAAALVEYQAPPRCLNFRRLAAALPPGPGIVVDGIAGDTLLRGPFAGRRPVESSDWRHGTTLVFDHYAPPAGRLLLEDGAWERVRAVSRDAFFSQAGRFAGHPSATMLGYYWTRTRRRIGLSTVKVFGAGHGLALPFLADSVARLAVAAPPEERLEGRLNRRILDLANREVGRLPATYDQRFRAPYGGATLAWSAEAQRTYLSLLERSPLLPWLSPALRRAVDRGRLPGRYNRSYWLLERLQSLCAFTLWAHRYGDLVSDLDPQGLLGPVPTGRGLEPARG